MRRPVTLFGSAACSGSGSLHKEVDCCESAPPIVRPGQTFRVIRYRPPNPHQRGAADVDAAERARRLPELARRAAKRLPLFD